MILKGIPNYLETDTFYHFYTTLGDYSQYNFKQIESVVSKLETDMKEILKGLDNANTLLMNIVGE